MSTLEVVKEKSTRLAKVEKGKEEEEERLAKMIMEWKETKEEEEKVKGANLVSFVAKT